MGLVSTWLNGIGLSRAVPTFQAAGIVTPAALAELDVTHFEALGIEDADDRRKLFYLVQRIKMAVNKDKNQQSNSVENQVDAVLSETNTTAINTDDNIVNKNANDANDKESDDETDEEYSPETNLEEEEEEQDEEAAIQEEQPEPMVTRRSKRLAAKQATVAIQNISGGTATSRKSTQRGAKSKSAIQQRTRGKSSRVEEASVTEESDLPQETPSRPSTRQSKRLSSKHNAKANAVFNLNEGDDDDEENIGDDNSGIKNSTNERRVSGSMRSKSARKKSGLQQPKASSASSSFSDNESVGETKEIKPTVTPVSKMQAPKSRRPESKLQNPGKSMRTGKRLSTIPSEGIAPMSPLVAMPQSKLEKEDEDDGENQGELRRSNSRKKQSTDSLDDLLQSSNSDMGSMGEVSDVESDNESITNVKKSMKNRSKSMGGVETGLRTPASSRIARPLRRKSSKNGDLNASFDSSLLSSSSKRSVMGKSDSSSRLGSKTPFVQGGTTSESFATKIEYLRQDNDEEHELFQDQADQQLYDYDMRIRVIVRKRPVSKSEAELSGGIDVIHPLDYGDYGRTLVYQPKTRVDLTKEIETVPFSFDNVFGEESTNSQIYQRSLKYLIQPFFKGQWATVFAYGQTGSGKTYTMMGSNMTGINAGTATNDAANLGLYYLAALDIFEMLQRPEYNHLSVQISLFEIYGGKLYDLLNRRKQVKCLEDSRGKVCFPGLTEHPAEGPDEVMELIEEGAKNRSTGTTSRNADSSRSHAVLQIKLRKDVGRRKNVEHGRINFIDLAGSERGADTSSCSRATRLEGAEINTSLLALKEVIRALATGGSMTRIPFRGSKLTQVLKDSFVGKNSRCCMVACISPDIGNCEQTLNTLRYADRVKERNAETGALPASCEQPKRLSPIQLDRNPIQEQTEPVEEEGIEYAASSSKEFDEENDAEVSTMFQSEADKVVLDDLLSTPIQDPPKIVSAPNSPIASSTKQDAGEKLVSSHRSVMSSMLAMVKNEMALVNKVDADRDWLDEYLAELHKIQTTQLTLISKLRQSLNSYVTAAEAPHAEPSQVESDDESFEDLRD